VNIETLKAGGFRTVFVPYMRFGFHYLTTGPLEITIVAGRQIKCRVMAFNWSAARDPRFHSLN
jgi:hypothetical protein